VVQIIWYRSREIDHLAFVFPEETLLRFVKGGGNRALLEFRLRFISVCLERTNNSGIYVIVIIIDCKQARVDVLPITLYSNSTRSREHLIGCLMDDPANQHSDESIVSHGSLTSDGVGG
jgi:hypothetical protein